jgi:thymidylate synthase
MPDGGTFDQFESLIEEAKVNPHLRTLFISPWIPFHIPRRPGVTQKVVVAPCHGWVHVFITEGKLSLHMIQRSADMPVGVPCNMIQYAALTMVLASILECEPEEYIHSFSDAHIYVDQVPHVEEMLSREPRSLPTVTLNREITNIHQYSGDDFSLTDYNPHPGIKEIPVAT